jgi:hypothetical protein
LKAAEEAVRAGQPERTAKEKALPPHAARPPQQALTRK